MADSWLRDGLLWALVLYVVTTVALAPWGERGEGGRRRSESTGTTRKRQEGNRRREGSKDAKRGEVQCWA